MWKLKGNGKERRTEFYSGYFTLRWENGGSVSAGGLSLVGTPSSSSPAARGHSEATAGPAREMQAL